MGPRPHARLLADARRPGQPEGLPGGRRDAGRARGEGRLGGGDRRRVVPLQRPAELVAGGRDRLDVYAREEGRQGRLDPGRGRLEERARPRGGRRVVAALGEPRQPGAPGEEPFRGAAGSGRGGGQLGLRERPRPAVVERPGLAGSGQVAGGLERLAGGRRRRRLPGRQGGRPDGEPHLGRAGREGPRPREGVAAGAGGEPGGARVAQGELELRGPAEPAGPGERVLDLLEGLGRDPGRRAEVAGGDAAAEAEEGRRLGLGRVARGRRRELAPGQGDGSGREVRLGPGEARPAPVAAGAGLRVCCREAPEGPAELEGEGAGAVGRRRVGVLRPRRRGRGRGVVGPGAHSRLARFMTAAA